MKNELAKNKFENLHVRLAKEGNMTLGEAEP